MSGPYGAAWTPPRQRPEDIPADPRSDAEADAQERAERRLWTCPACGSPATYCTSSDHGQAINGPAVHCTTVPRHNAWSPKDWAAWSDAERGSS